MGDTWRRACAIWWQQGCIDVGYCVLGTDGQAGGRGGRSKDEAQRTQGCFVDDAR
jgi:hypothetical protein